MDRADSINIYEATADFYYTDIEKVNAYISSRIFYGDTNIYTNSSGIFFGSKDSYVSGSSQYDNILFNDIIIENPYNFSADFTPDDSIIDVFKSVENSEMWDFWMNPFAWKDYSSQTFRYTAAKGNWTLLVTNKDPDLGTRLTLAKVIFNVA